MAKAILICGKICSGKSVYARRLRLKNKAVLLSVDEIMLAMFGLYTGEKHDEYTDRLQEYLFKKSLEIIETGNDVILDWGFWTADKRAAAREFYKSRNIAYEFHYMDVSDETWKERILNRNNAVSAGDNSAYFIDSNLAAKFETLFEAPDKNEMDVWIKC